MLMKELGLAAIIGISTLSLAGCAAGYGDDYRAGYDRPPGGPYYADQYYRDDSRYQERRLHRGDRVYVGRDGRYYCKRSDGTTGLIVGGIAGGVLGNIIAPGGSKTLGTLLGAAGGAAVGTSVDKSDVRCR
jgi:outer membrane lipoprotein SlyB